MLPQFSAETSLSAATHRRYIFSAYVKESIKIIPHMNGKPACIRVFQSDIGECQDWFPRQKYPKLYDKCYAQAVNEKRQQCLDDAGDGNIGQCADWEDCCYPQQNPKSGYCL